MDKHRVFQLLRCFCLAFALSWSGSLCMAAGLDHSPLPHLWAVWSVVSAAFTAAAAAGSRRRQVLPVALALAAGVRIPPLPAMIGYLAALGVCRTVCRGKSIWLPGVASLAGLGLCLVRPDAFPSREALFLLLTGEGVLLITAHTRFQHPRQGNRLTLTAAPVLAAVFGLILFLNPPQSYVNRSLRVQQILLQRFPSGNRYIARLAGICPAAEAPARITLKRTLSEPTGQPVMTVTAGETGRLYLRQRGYDRYDGSSWTATESITEDFSAPGSGIREAQIHTQTVYAQRFLSYYPPDGVTLEGGALANPDGLTRYTLRYTAPAAGSAPGDNLTPEQLSHYLTLPEETRRGAEAYLAPLLVQRESSGEKAAAIAEALGQGSYSLNPQPLREEGDFVLGFLEGEPEGSCTHYAAAAAVLLRCAGIPARLAAGYLVEGQAGVAVTVTDGDAHAWVEYYDAELGFWQVLDPTPSGEGQVSTTPTAAPVKETRPRNDAALLPVLLLPELLFRLRRGLRKIRLRRLDPNARALALWQEARLVPRLLREPVSRELAALARKARFSPHQLTEGELSVFRDTLDSYRCRLKKKFFLKRLVHRWVYGVY